MQDTTVFNLIFAWASQCDPRTNSTNFFHALIIDRTDFLRAHSAGRSQCHIYLLPPGDTRTKPTSGAQATADYGLKVGEFCHLALLHPGYSAWQARPVAEDFAGSIVTRYTGHTASRVGRGAALVEPADGRAVVRVVWRRALEEQLFER